MEIELLDIYIYIYDRICVCDCVCTMDSDHHNVNLLSWLKYFVVGVLHYELLLMFLFVIIYSCNIW